MPARLLVGRVQTCPVIGHRREGASSLVVILADDCALCHHWASYLNDPDACRVVFTI